MAANDQLPDNTGIATKDGAARLTVWEKPDFVLGAVLFVSSLVVYAMSLASRPLLDEQFLLSWLTHMKQAQGSSSASGFFLWPGFASFDQWGPVTHATLVGLAVIFKDKIFLYRFFSVLVHSGCAVLLYGICRRIRMERLVAFASALIFLLYPASAEAVAWLGGIGVQLAVFFLLAAACLYLRAAEGRFSWIMIGASLGFCALSLASSAVIWPGVLAIGLILPIFRLSSSGKWDLSQKSIAALLYLVLLGVFFAAKGGIDHSLFPDFQRTLEMAPRFFMPINQIAWKHYSREYVLYYVIFVPTLLSLFFCIWKNARYRYNVLATVLCLLLVLLPVVGHAASDSSLAGGRWLYFAAIPFSMLIAFACFGGYLAFDRFKIPLKLLSCLLVLVFCVVYVRHLWNQNCVYRNSGRILGAIQKSISIANSKESLPFLILRDMPERLSLSPEYSVKGPVCFDAQSGLLRSNPVPDGRLKDLLRQDKLLSCVRRWESNLQSFIPLDLELKKHSWKPDMTPEEIGNRLEPRLPFYKTVSLDDKENVLVLETNSERGPMIVLLASELSPLDGDYLVLEARITAPSSVIRPRIELHWQTRVHEDFDAKERYAYAEPVLNDRQYHSYFLSLRSAGWTTGGSSRFIALGFPSGSRVDLRRAYVCNAPDKMAKLEAVLPNESAPAPRYTPPYYNYPTVQDLGLIALPDSASSLVAQYSVDGVPEAEGVLVEISRPDKSFDDANSDHLSAVTLKTLRMTGKEGRLEIPVSDLPGAGVYSLRVIGTNARGFNCGMFSDPLCYQVPLKQVRP